MRDVNGILSIDNKIWFNSAEKCELRICGFNDLQINQLKKSGFVDITITDIDENNNNRSSVSGIYHISGMLYIGEDLGVYITNVRRCSRCGVDHYNIVFRKFINGSLEYTHWGMCPILNEPITMKFDD